MNRVKTALKLFGSSAARTRLKVSWLGGPCSSGMNWRNSSSRDFANRAISVQCVGDLPPAYTTLANFRAAGGTASDACSANLAFSLVSDSGLVGRCPGTVTRVYRLVDDCGNFADGTQRITIDDTIAPTLTCPPALNVEYGTSMDPSVIGRATATDNCSTNVTITYNDSSISSSYSVNF